MEAAKRVVDLAWSADNTEALRKKIARYENPVLVSTLSSSGRNMIPVALGERLAAELGIPFQTGETHWRRLHDLQAKQIDAGERAYHPRLYQPKDLRALAKELGGRDVVLVEDTMTTGQTVYLFAQALHQAGVPVRTVATLFGNPDVSPGERQIEKLQQALRAKGVPIQAAELAKGLSTSRN